MYIIYMEKDNDVYKKEIFCNYCGKFKQCVVVVFGDCENYWYCMECLRFYAKSVKKEIDSFEKDCKDHSELLILIENYERLKEVI